MDDNEHHGVESPPGERSGPGSGDETARRAEGPASGEVRIAAIQAAVAAEMAELTGTAGAASSDPARGAPGRGASATRDDEEEFAPFSPPAIVPSARPSEEEGALGFGDEDVLAAFGIPDWTDPPTGQIPRVLLDDPDAARDAEAAVPGPIWREDASDWDDVAAHLTYLAEETEETVAIAGREPESPTGEHDLLGLSELDAALSGTLHRGEEEPAGASALDPSPGLDDEDELDPFARRRRARDRRRARRAGAVIDETSGGREPDAPRRSGVVATATGVVLGLIALCCVLGGSASSLGLATAVLVLATGEVFGALRRAGFAPATLVGLLAVPALVIGAYLRGTPAVVLIGALALVVCALWSLSGVTSRNRVTNLAVSLFVIAWVGLLGAFAGLLLSPSAYPHRFGVDLFFGALAVTVAHDVGSYVVGSRLGRHRLAPRLSPGKSVEGLLGGAVFAFAVALALVWRIAPFDVGDVLGLAALVSVFAPIGDLFESLVKRDLGLKDMGSLLPGHGGIFDRIDAMLFVLPASYYFVRLVHFG